VGDTPKMCRMSNRPSYNGPKEEEAPSTRVSLTTPEKLPMSRKQKSVGCRIEMGIFTHADETVNVRELTGQLWGNRRVRA